MDENTTPPESSQDDDSLKAAFEMVDADVLNKLAEYIDKHISPMLSKSTPEQRQELVTAINAYMTSESEDAKELEALNDVIDEKVRVIVTIQLGVDGGEKFDELCDQICDALDEAVEEVAVYGQLKGHEMMGAMFGLDSNGPVRIENGEVLTTVAMGGGVRNPDGSWTEFGDDIGKANG